MPEEWGKKLENAMGETLAEFDVSTLVGVASDAARSAAWWQAQCQGRDLVIAELREQVGWLRGKLDRPEVRVPVAGSNHQGVSGNATSGDEPRETPP